MTGPILQDESWFRAEPRTPGFQLVLLPSLLPKPEPCPSQLWGGATSARLTPEVPESPMPASLRLALQSLLLLLRMEYLWVGVLGCRDLAGPSVGGGQAWWHPIPLQKCSSCQWNR